MRGSLMRALVLVLVASVSTVGDARAQASDLLDRSTTYGVKAGLFYPGCVYVNDSDCFDSDVSFGFGGFVDTRLGEKILGGVSLDVGDFSVETVSELLFEIDLNLKADLMNPGSTVGFRPGVGLGYGFASVQDETLSSFTIRGLVEAVFPGDPVNWMAEAALYASPAGGTESADLTWGPGLLLRAGVLF